MKPFSTCVAILLLVTACSSASNPGDVPELRMPTGAGGVGFLPLRVMQQEKLIEAHAREAGIPDLSVRWVEVGGPAVLNDALLSGSIDFIAAGPPAFITLWDRTVESVKVMGTAAVAALPMYLNTKAAHLQSVDDLRDTDKVGVTAIKVSIPSLVMQMHARDKYGASQATRFDKNTVAITHPDGVVALLSGSNAITAHFTSPPFHQRERKDPQVRTIMTSDEVMGGATTFVMLSTTARFRDENPAVYRAVLAALRDAQARIAADPKAAAGILLSAEGQGGFTVDEMAAVLADPDVHFTAAPQNTMKYATFMHDIGSISHRPASWKDMFFPEVHDEPGN
ncbi:MAG: ABC transporter substrate-binding protein [Vicinamibacterales bacterium]